MRNILHHSYCRQPYIPTRKNYVRPFVLDEEKLTTRILTHVWSPIVFKDFYRTEKAFLYADWLVLDFDDGETTLAQASQNIFADHYHLIATTRSHTEEHHRFRVCIPLEKRIENIRDYKHTLSYYTKKYGSDGQCKDAARYYYPSSTIHSRLCEPGLYLAEVHQAPQEPYEPTPIAKGEYSRFVRKHIGQVVPQGTRDVVTWGIARDLAKAGFNKAEAKDFIKQWLRYEGHFDFEAKVDVVFKQLAEGR